MMKLNIIRISRHDFAEHDSLINMPFLVYGYLQYLREDYPNFKQWYFGKVISGLDIGTRELVVALIGNTIVGVAILKSTQNERKVCTLRVHNQYQKYGIGSLLMAETIKILEIDKPVISVASHRVDQFASLFKKYGFKLVEKCVNYYREGATEYVYNGLLNKDDAQFGVRELIVPLPGNRFGDDGNQFGMFCRRRLEIRNT